MRKRIHESEGDSFSRETGAGMSRRRMNGLWLVPACTMGVCLGVAIGGGLIGIPDMGSATELHFVIRDVEEGRAAWYPREVSLHYWSEDFTELLTFRLENPTGRTHVFEAPGLFESVEAGGGRTAKPVRITIAPEETMRILIDRDRMANDVIGSEDGTTTYRYYCSLHGEEPDASMLRVVP